MRTTARCSTIAGAALLVVTTLGSVFAGECAPEPPLAVDDVPALSPDDEAFIDDFRSALAQFREMPLEEFRARFGPDKRYRRATLEFIRGDANGDSQIGLPDAVCILRYLFVGTGPCRNPDCKDRFDVDDSGDISLTDAIGLLRHLFQDARQPPPPFPLPGDDPTEDALECPPAPKLDYDPMAADYLGLITEVYPLTAEQEDVFRENGFVMLADAIEHWSPTFLSSYLDLFYDHLPVYISVDSMLDALHLSFDRVLLTIEEERLIGELDTMLTRLDDGVEALERYSGGVDLGNELDDVAFWICTARSLLRGEKAPCRRGVDATVEEFLDHVASEEIREVSFFGHLQCEDFSQFKPRSHYTETEELERYFRAMMWVQRIGMKFAQLERHAAVAFLLSRALVDTGAIENWNVINAVVEEFVGTSDSLNAPGMVELAHAAELTTVAELYAEGGFADLVRTALETGAGRQLINSQIILADPTAIDGFTPIPPAYHLMGQRFIVDSFVFTNVVFDRACRWECPAPCSAQSAVNCGRLLPSPLDAWFALGNRATVPLLADELETYFYHPHLAALDWIVSRYPEEFWSSSLYNVWLSALRTLSADTTGESFPSVMQTEEWDRRMLHAQLASWAQLRHDTLLYAKPSYTWGDCEYVDGWVDPYPEFFDTLAAFGARSLARFEALGLFDIPSGEGIRSYLQSLESHSRELAGIARAELENLPLSEEQSQFIQDLSKRVPEAGAGSGGVPANGWYTDLVFQPPSERNNEIYNPEGLPFPEEFSPTIADIHTDPSSGRVLHVGVGKPNLMLISVKTDCGIKAYAGPTFSYYEFAEEDLRRLTDEEWRDRLWTEDVEVPDWARAFVR